MNTTQGSGLKNTPLEQIHNDSDHRFKVFLLKCFFWWYDIEGHELWPIWKTCRIRKCMNLTLKYFIVGYFEQYNVVPLTWESNMMKYCLYRSFLCIFFENFPLRMRFIFLIIFACLCLNCCNFRLNLMFHSYQSVRIKKLKIAYGHYWIKAFHIWNILNKRHVALILQDISIACELFIILK